ncbi:NTP transferase domain-containing protein [Luteolibacter sp. SL250]|uniref:NTP transferase domain-containing protein n=1 Tax=Luteolibacter sp. SL250 TaxID=2995170 RepID=UPI00226E7BA1|nr:NTP transferase domain-containing protein [Luteolibacter sp. SL250]WAC18075.1 NTP transferase domain-containing protein [Luteolibacter sp. SL250]
MSGEIRKPLCGLVLAGGRSSRMGTDKASLLHPDGRTLGRRCHDLLEQAGCADVYLSLRADQEVPEGFADKAPELLRDADGSSGPVSGILAAMNSRPDADWLVVACDLPRLDLASLEHLLSSRREGELFLAYRSEFDSLPEPLCTWYSSEAREVVVKADHFCPRKILIRNECRLLEPMTNGALDNANTPEDWKAATES